MKRESCLLLNNVMADATFTIYSGGPVEKVEVIEGFPNDGSGTSEKVFESANAEIARLCQALREMAQDINIFYEKNVSEHREAIARLSVEIARKILAKNINERDYKIEDIIKEALKSVPVRKDIVVCVNPQDYAQLRKLQTQGEANPLEGIELVSDSAVGLAECVIQTSKGTIRSLIDEHLERIGLALGKTG
jgi:flagellar biosynthesis/type III secretory pathway protein FliH